MSCNMELTSLASKQSPLFYFNQSVRQNEHPLRQSNLYMKHHAESNNGSQHRHRRERDWQHKPEVRSAIEIRIHEG